MADSQRETISTENGTQVAKEILDVKSAAKILGCSASHISNILNGKVEGVPPIPHVRAGRLRLIRRAALMRWFEDQEQASQELPSQ
jgi:excisionase family DNA binding protein